jgi:CDP-paratose 2-epimerase
VSRDVLIFGGAGFVGCNLAAHLANSGQRIRVYDDLSGDGVDRNLHWLQKTFGDRIETVIADVRDGDRVRAAVRGASAVFQLVAQGTIEVLEAVRAQARPAPLVLTSTRTSADPEVLDHAQRHGVPATVLRTSCVYGPHQRGSDHKDWITQFLMAAITDQPITIHGHGKQIRDILFVDDLVDAFVRAWSRMGLIAGRVFELGGGVDFALSPANLLDLIEALRGRRPEVHHEEWRAGDEPYHVANTAPFTEATGWRPRVPPRSGVEALHGWLVQHGGRHA